MNHLCATFKGSKISYHGVPIMLGQGRCVIAAMLHENTRAHDLINAFLCAALTLHRSKIYLRQHVRQLILSVFTFRMEADAGHLHGSILFAVHEAGKPHNPRLVHTHRIAIKMFYELRLYHAETLHFSGRVHEPVHMIGFLCFHYH